VAEEALRRLSPKGDSTQGSIVVLGVGNRLRGDDAVGCIICDELGKDRIPGFKDSRSQVPYTGILDSSTPRPLSDSVFVLDCGDTPENYVEPVAKLKPCRILVIDCCDFGAEAGEFRLFCRQELEDLSYGLLSTHTLPLSLTVELLSLETGATIELLGIQPERIEFGEEMSAPVQRALPAVVEFVRNWVQASLPGL
jgi:hydrogenase 3 maturation protease